MGIENIDDLKPDDSDEPSSKEITEKRAELRRLSELRSQAGLTPYPTEHEVKIRSRELRISQVEAHDKLIHEDERILNEQDKGQNT